MFFKFFSEIFGYREYLKQSIMRDLRTKYKRSFLGYLWTMLHPLTMMIILAVVFSNIMRVPMKDYVVFLFGGLLPWNYFQSTVVLSLNSIKTNARLFGQVAVPKYIFILSITFSNLVNYILALAPLIVVMLVMGRPIPWTIVALPVMLLPLFCMVVGIALIVATANVFFDDTLHLTEVGLQALYFLSPILYSRAMLPDWVVKYLVFNPLFYQIEFIRGLFYEGMLPNWTVYSANLAGSLVILGLGLLLFRKSEDKFLYFV